jgi:hypothetical protein
LSKVAKSLPFSTLTATIVSTRKDPREETKDGAGFIMMPQKKRASEYQESQQLSAAEAPGLEPMTGAQATYLKTLAEEVDEPGAYQQGLSKREASRRINALAEKLRLGELPPHTD